jgi:hypothetical protein
MGYSADDFFEDIVRNAKTIDYLISGPGDPRGLLKFIKYLLSRSSSSLLSGVQELLDDEGAVFIVYSDSNMDVCLRGTLPENCTLTISPPREEN